MKALELADFLNETAQEHRHDEAATELRRLAKVNVELLGALEAMLNADRAYEYGGYSETELAAIKKAQLAIAKAKEQ